MSVIQLYRKRSVPPLTAVQFKGWQNASEIYRWGAPVFYVPRGAEHVFRTDNEHDRSNGHTLEDAREFLVLQLGPSTSSVDATYSRVNVGEWVCRDNDGEWFSRTDAQFQAEFESLPNPGTGVGGGGFFHV